jgi:hypothetical protein
MLKRIVIVLVSIVCLTLSCSSVRETTTLEGTWQMVSGRYETPTNIVICDKDTRLCYKLIGEHHFSVVEMYRLKPDSAFFAAVGRFELKDSLYTEILEGCNNPNMVGDENVFESTLTGNTWRIYRKTNDSILDETWTRVKASS